MFTVQLDEARLARGIADLAAIQNKSLFEAMRGQAKLIVEDCIKRTPPNTFERSLSEGGQAQKQIGIKAVTRDVRKLFRPYRDADFAGSFQRGDRSFKAGLARVMRRKNWEKAYTMLRSAKQRIKGVIPEATNEIHQQWRDRRGRIRGEYPFLVVDGKSVNQVLRHRLAHIGLGKSGWLRAALALKSNLKGFAWVKKHPISGTYSETQGETPSITVSNTVPFIQDSGVERQIIARAFADRIGKLETQVETEMAIKLRKRGVQVHRGSLVA